MLPNRALGVADPWCLGGKPTGDGPEAVTQTSGVLPQKAPQKKLLPGFVMLKQEQVFTKLLPQIWKHAVF